MSVVVRLVQVIPDHKLGGMQRVAYDLNETLPMRGVMSTILVLRDFVAPEGATIGPIAMVRAWLSLVNWLREERPDAIMAHSVFGALFAMPAALIAKVRRRVLVIHLVRDELGAKRALVAVLLGASGLLNGIVFCGETVGRTFRCWHWLVRHKECVIQNGIDVEGVMRAVESVRSRAILSEGATFVTAARLVAVKNICLVIEALALMKVPARLVVCGEGPEMVSLRKQVSRLGVDVTFTGRLSQEELFSRYGTSQAYLAPSLGEGLPLGLIEAAAARLPVVAADREFNREILGEFAVYADPEVVREWADAMDRIANRLIDVSAMVTGAQQRARHFDLARMADDYAALLRKW